MPHNFAICWNVLFLRLMQKNTLEYFFGKGRIPCHLMQKCIWCKNAFGAKMHLVQKCIWCKNAFGAKMHLVQKCIWCKNAFGAKMHLVQKCIWCKNAFGAKMHFCNATQRNATQRNATQRITIKWHVKVKISIL